MAHICPSKFQGVVCHAGTAGAGKSPTRIDYIWTSQHCRVLQADITLKAASADMSFSDHFGVSAKLELTPGHTSGEDDVIAHCWWHAREHRPAQFGLISKIDTMQHPFDEQYRQCNATCLRCLL